MPNINIENISDLDLNGNSLFEDSEGFMTELSEDNDLDAIYGGARPTRTTTDPQCYPTTCQRFTLGPCTMRTGF